MIRLFSKFRCLIGTSGLMFLIAALNNGCSLLDSKVELNDPLSVPDRYVFFPKPSSNTLAKEQNAITTMMMNMDTNSSDPRERAEIFYNIGTIYDDLGLESMARFMYMNALVQNPLYYRPYQVLGPYFFREGKIGDAVDSLDAALELVSDRGDPYIYLHRGIIMYYTGHYRLACEDMKMFYDTDPSDPYRMMCLYTATIKYDGMEKARKLLTDYYETYKNQEAGASFGFNFIKLHLGSINTDEMFEAVLAARDDEDVFQEHLCETYYYLGQLMLLKGKDKLAYDYFKLCEAARKYGFLEHRLAIYEMAELERRYNGRSTIQSKLETN